MYATFAIATVTLAFVAFYFITHAERWKEFFNADKDNEREVHAQRLAGFLFYGIFPAIVVASIGLDWKDAGTSFQMNSTDLLWVLGVGSLTLIFNWFVTQTPANLAVYPMIRRPAPWSMGLVLKSALSWTAYLLAYEFVFRGFLLFTTARELGVATAIVINISLYVLAHIHKGLVESLGSILMGFLLCHICLEAGNIWPAVIVHVILGLGNEWLSLKWLKRKS
ncbi:MAG: hypothetical protein RI973_448 [Bacteroidota bacterium]|jgi:membrane protease YdiL (CAAX protease family)